jgi:hypothetical protein
MRLRVRTFLIVAILFVIPLTAAGCGAGGSRSAASGKCSGLAHLAEASQKFSTFLTGSNPDPKKFVEESHDFAVFRYLDLVGGAPNEIRGGIQVLDDAWQKYVDAIAAWDPEKLAQKALKKLDAIADLDLKNLDQEKLDAIADPDLRKALEKLEHSHPPSIEIDEHRIMQASQNISAWVQRRMQKDCT